LWNDKENAVIGDWLASNFRNNPYH